MPHHNRRILLFGAIFFIAFGFSFGIGGLYDVRLTHEEYTIALSARPPLFVRSTAAAAMYAAPLGSIVFIALGALSLYRRMSGQLNPPRVPTKSEKVLVVLAIATLLTIF